MAVKKYLDYTGLKKVLKRLLPGARKIWHGTEEEWYDLPDAERDKYDQAEIIDANSIVEPMQYTTNEEFTGKIWIDGKKIYRKVINGTFSNGNTIMTGVGAIISCIGEYTSGETVYPFPGAVSAFTIALTKSSGTITAYIGVGGIKARCTFILEYTKKSK